MEILQRSNGIMEWNRLQTVHLTEDMRKKLEEIENYLEKQDYFSNEKLNRSRIIDMLILTFCLLQKTAGLNIQIDLLS